MPKRSNAFQRLVYVIQHQLSDNAVITESEMLIDRQTGNKTEVDIVIKTEINDYDVIVSVEVVDRSRKASVQWVREMIGKHATLPTNKLILVSHAGFSKEALTKASANGVETFEFNDAESFPWAKSIDELCGADGTPCFAFFNLSSERFQVSFLDTKVNNSSIREQLTSSCFFHNGQTGSTGKLFDVPGSLLNSQHIALPIIKSWIESGREREIVTWSVPEGTFIETDSGDRLAVESVTIHVVSNVESKELTFEQVTIGKTQVLHSVFEGSEPSRSGLVTAIEREGEPFSMSVAFGPENGNVEEIKPFNLIPKN